MSARGIFAAVSVFFMATAAAAPAAAPVPGVTDTEVTIGITGPLSGPAAAWGALGVAAITVCQAENSIVVVPGARSGFTLFYESLQRRSGG